VLDDEPQGRRQINRLKRAQKLPTQPRKGKVPIELPITVRSLSEALGQPKVQILFKLKDHGLPNMTINSTVDAELAEVLALETGCELEIKRAVDVEERLLEEFNEPDAEEDLVPRAPVVTVMGHVDHGKTSLLDKIRKSNVVATEAGGITQVIRAWRVEHGGRPITFLDTPGHEAFTKMRARGAQVTDVAVIVVAADDGVMPQTEEAVNHAKAAGVSLVVAINKVDLPSANLNKTRQQLYGLGVLPDNMGGDTPFVETSAASGKGIDELLDQLSVVAELKELKANPDRPARGTVLEAMLSEGEGVRATLLVQNGTLHKGDVILAGASYGRVRQMYDDLGRPIEEAGPSVPVRITGLDEVPNADDPFYVVPDLITAREIADKHRVKLQEVAVAKRPPLSLENLTQAKIAELKIILKADFRGSIEAIRKELEKLKHDEVEVQILQAAIGGVSESDVDLALTSPQDTIIVGFNVVPDDRAKALAEEKGVSIREYNVIYMLTDDVRAALEGKLKPRQEVINLGRAVVRETFKVSRVGTIAGCYVTQGVIKRSAKVRLIRDGVVIYPPPDKSVGLDSLKRFKDDASEVREGFECGLKIAGYDDVKVGDVIEAYRIEEVQRTLDQG
jgi:translation initiation factor IF-2